MQIVQVSTHENRRFIPVKGWESVAKALSAYADGSTQGARATTSTTADYIGREGRSDSGLAVGMFLLGGTMIAGRSKLVESLLGEAEAALKHGTGFHKSYDYDGMGTSFFKTSVNINVLDRDQDMYSIGIHAAYVGDKPEQGLADHFGIPRTLLSCSVEVETEPLPGDRFEFDFEPALRKMDAVLGTSNITGEQVATAMLLKNDDGNPAFVLQNGDGLEVRIQLGRVERRMNHSGQRPRDTWAAKGSVFSGELQRDYRSSDANSKATPTFFVSISSSQKDGWRSLPIWHPDQQRKAIELANAIATALR